MGCSFESQGSVSAFARQSCSAPKCEVSRSPNVYSSINPNLENFINLCTLKGKTALLIKSNRIARAICEVFVVSGIRTPLLVCSKITWLTLAQP